ncbi:MAG: hypothetical protein ACXV7J_11355 [Methylomonas sp.]
MATRLVADNIVENPAVIDFPVTLLDRAESEPGTARRQTSRQAALAALPAHHSARKRGASVSAIVKNRSDRQPPVISPACNE